MPISRISTVEGVLSLATACFVLVWAGLVKVPFRHQRDANTLLLANDPPWGELIPLPSKDALGRTLTGQSLWLIAVGSCTSCTLQAFDPTSIRSEENRVALLIQAKSVRELPKLYAEASKTQFVVLDPNGDLQSKLNAFFMPRFFEVDSQHRLIRSSNKPNQVPERLRK